ncbi:hypothetical protein T265_10248 [Opisthorchis viverrini]|uniref:Uncharacterized protein n=1 Tax=Opisthorchis viverrini TaxID=6198 RepID=A0A074Z2Y6_OPIVI|nr:hypothetical protein T265_10248 [Opisthorchis viverrini]KER21431.1 hypothetical protein T265_10248 [Opisthorchis viverrini]
MTINGDGMRSHANVTFQGYMQRNLPPEQCHWEDPPGLLKELRVLADADSPCFSKQIVTSSATAAASWNLRPALPSESDDSLICESFLSPFDIHPLSDVDFSICNLATSAFSVCASAASDLA